MDADAKLTPQERLLRYALMFMALVFAGFIVAYVVDGAFFDIDGNKGDEKFPFVANAVTKDGLFLAVTLIAIGNLRRFGWLTILVILGHVMLIASLGLMLVTGNTDGAGLLPFGSEKNGVSAALLWCGVDVVIAAGLTVLYRRAQLPRGDLFASTSEQLTKREGYLRFGLGLMAVVFAGFIVAYVVDGLNGNGQFPFVANSVTKDGLFLAVTLLAINNLRRFGWMTLLVIMGHLTLIASLILMWATGNTAGADLLPLGSEQDWEMTMLIWGGADVLVVIGLSILYWRAERARHGLKYLWPYEFATIEALSDVLIDDDQRALRPDEIACNVDGYLSKFKATGKWKVRLAIAFLTISPFPRLPLPMMERSARLKFVRRHFVPESESGSTNGGPPVPSEDGWWRAFVQRMISVGAQLAYFGYYGDAHTFPLIDYKRYEDRDGVVMPPPDPTRPRLKTEPANGRVLRGDVVIVGSGAAGAILAYELADRGRDVILLERGELVDRSEFTDDESAMLSKLYRDGALQVSRDFRFAVLQGMCVGGSTVVNNAVSIKAPTEVLDDWNDASGLNAGLHRPSLDASFEHIRQWLEIKEQPATTFSRGAKKLLEGADALGINHKVVEANIAGCRGCGYCNIGCQFGAKLSMLDKVLPDAQKNFDGHPPKGQVRIVPNCRAKRIVMNGVEADGVRCKVDGHGALLVRANESVIVAAGAISSSLLLQRSGVGRDLPVGENLSFNMATPLTAHFEDRLCSYEGLQISHYLSSPAISACVMETWFNPPAFQSLFMPGWFENHTDNMRQYSHMAVAGVVVGTSSNGSVRRGITGEFGFKPSATDMHRLIEGLKLAGRMFLKADATRVMPATLRYHEIATEAGLADLDIYKTRPGLSLNSAHPQGGNAISVNADRGVVDPSFRVHGVPNLYVCDASVFPSSITVNPQFTVMALAHYAASKIAGPPPPPAAAPAVLPAAPSERFPRAADVAPDGQVPSPDKAGLWRRLTGLWRSLTGPGQRRD